MVAQDSEHLKFASLHLKMAVLFKWFGMVLFALACLAICPTEAKCRGKAILTELEGSIESGPDICEWLIKGPHPNISITITLTELKSECSRDFLFIYDGDTYFSPLIASISGSTLPSPIVAHSGKVLINLYHEFDFSLHGFTLNYTIENCTNGCSGQGNCENGYCQCDKLRRGKACQLPACPLHCGTAEGRGQCNFNKGHCECNDGYIGESCSLSTLTDADSNKWFNISSTSSVFTPRMAHSLVYVENSDTLLAFGGYTLNRVFDDLLQFDLVTSLWSVIQPGTPQPTGRFSHSANLYFDSMVLFGGKSQNGSLNNDLWLYNITLNKWTELSLDVAMKPPPVAEHTATVVDDKLYIFGGRTIDGQYSSSIYSYSLSNKSGWMKVSYRRGNEHHLPLSGHSAVYYPDMRSIIFYGGFVPEGPRITNHSNKLLAFHVDLQVWSELASTSESGDVPKGRSFHSSVLVGDYMVIYGGSIAEDQCYDNRPLFYHLKCQKWISQQIIASLSSHSSNPHQGRFSHNAVLHNGTVMIVAGGFSGLPLGDILGYKLPIAVAAKSSAGSHCADYNTWTNCQDDPECGWCVTEGICLSQLGSCRGVLSSGVCQGQCAVFKQCSSCLSFGNGSCGWCVQDSTCYPKVSPSGACQMPTSANRESLQGWWGNSGQFLTLINHCQTMDFPPGITVVESQETPNDSLPDFVKIASTSDAESTLPYSYRIQLIGFVYPFKNQSAPWMHYALSLYVNTEAESEAKLWLSTDELESNIELVSYCNEKSGGLCTSQAKRNNSKDLFPFPSEDQKYFIKAEVINYVPRNDHVVSIWWNRTRDHGRFFEPLHGQFLQPYRNADCPKHTTCLSCMTNAACGWCSTSCVSRSSSVSFCVDNEGNQKMLTLNASECTVCLDHMDCSSCNQDSSCVWGIAGSLGCYRRGRVMSKTIENCSSPCASRKTCDSCVRDNIGCAWCDNSQTCFMIGTYTSQYPYGKCSHLIDSLNEGSQCPNCGQHISCKSCLADFRCGWCGNDYDPRIGRCFAGDFNSPYSGQCSSLFPTNGSTVWSYAECPDVDECRLGIAQCHHNATCFNLPDSFSCVCNRGYTGNGSFTCNKTCFHDCGIHGKCGADFQCDCDLGWFGENCSIDCGCNGHSDCPQGIGICENCQDNTHGNQCELCVPRSFGNATSSEGCNPCKCNGHGDPKKNVCDMSTGECFCTDFTIGPNCNMCEPGLKGNPKDGGLCFHECAPRSILTNVSEGYISTQLGEGVSSKSSASCLWLISSLSNSSHEVVYGPSPPPVGMRGHVTLSFEDIQINCLTDHVDIYDGLPPFLLGGLPSVQSFKKIGSFCGFGATNLKPVTATLGNMVVSIQANLDKSAVSKGFSAKFTVKKCRELCEGNQRCVGTSDGEQCICLEGWTGSKCDQFICPKNCSFAKGQGQCSPSLEGCACSNGFTGQDCSQVIPEGFGMWETLSNVPHLNLSGSHLARMGHTIVQTSGRLLVFGGYSLVRRLMNDVFSFNLTTHMWSHVSVNQTPETIPVARFLHSAVFYKDSMLIHGGQTANGTADQSLWLFNTTTLQWNKLSGEGPKVAGHSATLVENNMIIIGGYDHFLGFSETTHKYNLVTKQWSNLSISGPSPKGIYGHTAVYYGAKQVILVFGGYRFRIDAVKPSDALYSLDVVSNKWNLLQALPSNEPQPKYFHSAAIVNDTMVVFGGRSNTTDQLFSHQLLSYNIQCNYWHLFPDQSLLGSKPGGLLAAAGVSVGNRVYIFGGFNGQTQAAMSQLTLPSDLCQAITSKEKCVAVKICSWCEVLNVTQGGNISMPTNQTACFLTGSSVPVTCHAEPNASWVVFNNSSDCSMPSKLPCDSFYSCSACLASFPFSELRQQCQWCVGCPHNGECISRSGACHSSCQLPLRSSTSCVSDQSHYYEWNCFRHSLAQQANITIKSPPDNCPQLCSTHTNCTSCLSSKGGDGGWKGCFWSETLEQCFSPSYLPIICLAGLCGRVVQGSESGCMDSCSGKQWCSTCMTSYNCGWCAEKGTKGVGQCFEGGLQGPLSETCDTNNATSVASHVWASTLCPLENECKNGRHKCNRTANQVCVDTPESYRCDCKEGYSDSAQPGTCLPVCSKGCVHGRCVLPEQCVCHFGYTSNNCSVKCHCNNHGQCVNETLLDVCYDCRNNTVGQSCEFCEPLYVGDARNNGSCVSCYNLCHKRADVCMNRTMLEYGQDRNLSFELVEVKKWLRQGPYKLEHDKECLCRNNSFGVKCSSCIPGFFELPSGFCSSCLCNGHADFCNNKTGVCNCQNNTMEDCSRSSSNEKECYKNQCVKCKSQFMGNPINNQQCYRKISVSSEFVIGLKTDSTDESDGQALPYGQAIMYAVYPRFTNVDIRLTTDVFDGEVDVYMANENDEFTVVFNHTTGHHEVNVRGLSNFYSGKRKRRETEDVSNVGGSVVDIETASGVYLNTFVTYNYHHRALIVRQVRKRLVITFPHDEHHFRDTRFYMVFIGRHIAGTNGLVYFKQDISQIDLFVFFSVFFSSFFLVVSVSVFGWKIKQYHTRRRVIEVREHQLVTMRSRPFATYSFLHQTKKAQPCSWRIKRDTAALLLRDPLRAKQHQLRLREVRERPLLAPVSQEPTGNRRACVTTVIFQLPGNECSDFQLLLGSALTLVTNQHPGGSGEHHTSTTRKTVTRRSVTFTS